jgi:glycerol-3-phosphate dehydrogenase (NAD(P)+)
VRLWARRPELAEEITARHTNERYLAGFTLPALVEATSDLAEAVAGAQAVVMAVPSHGFRDVMLELAPYVEPSAILVSLTKGLEQSTLMRMSEVMAQVCPGHPVGVLTGPNLAKEVMAGQPAAAVVAMNDVSSAGAAQQLFLTSTFRVYTHTDVIGAEIAGVAKNVMAIAAGISDGMGFGDNTKATLVTRGLAEITRLGMALGGHQATFSGLAGVGDLVATCSSLQSRNHHVGVELGRGRRLADITGEMQMVAEGVKSAPVVLDLARRHGVDVPITEQVVEVVQGRATAATALLRLMTRSAKPEA